MADVIGSSTIVIDFREEFKHLDVCWQSLVFECHHILWQWPILRSPADILDVCFFLYWFAHLTSKYSIVDAPTIEGGQSQHSSGSAAKKKSHSKPPNTKNWCSIRRCHAWTIERLPSVQLDAKIDGYVYIQKNVINFRAIQTAVNDKYFAFGMEQHRNSSAAKSKTLIATNKHLNSNWRRPCMCPCNNGPTQTTAATTWKKKKRRNCTRNKSEYRRVVGARGSNGQPDTACVCVCVIRVCRTSKRWIVRPIIRHLHAPWNEWIQRRW